MGNEFNNPEFLLPEIDLSDENTDTRQDLDPTIATQSETLYDLELALIPNIELFGGFIDSGISNSTSTVKIEDTSLPRLFDSSNNNDNDSDNGSEIKEKLRTERYDFISFIRKLPADFKGIIDFLEYCNDFKNIHGYDFYICDKLPSFFCGDSINNISPFDDSYNSSLDKGFILNDSDIERMNRYGLILKYFIFELGIHISLKKDIKELDDYIKKNFISIDINKSKFSHISVKDIRFENYKNGVENKYKKFDDITQKKLEELFLILGNESIKILESKLQREREIEEKSRLEQLEIEKKRQILLAAQRKLDSKRRREEHNRIRTKINGNITEAESHFDGKPLGIK